ncbi:uncharacterized protein ASPGLDRAFT_866663 [Aspergillus glaucus CBS 516.65]|uniref:ATP-dependent DNA helicase n=1 Tax=Aspergillus glaucus CBS 516.65 TaxID=1160497 RepID=A0A1L9V8X5_ASPGL|nr:hypothetical protein ASPGLDRAFT_866663 [Aspergillus glaucus CBS 516.65]OJJ80361.1 hypothetical protein ASPGLDRAFT_866663 [Aspergillus glaucus CBS 516.65]
MLSLGRRSFPLTSRSMYAVTSRSRGLSSIRQFLHGSALGPQSAAAYSTSGRRSRTMFKRAVKDHSATASTAKPLQSNLLQGNTVSQSKPPQSSGVKRKIESAGESSLGSLHSAVYFDENDFDDDDDLNFEDPDPPIQTQSTVRPDTSVSRQKDSPGDDDDLVVTYPDLPPVPDEEAPPSSIQLPWSSSPPSHFQPPKPSRVQIPPSSKPRTVPWLNKEELVTKSAPPPVTPARKPKSTAIWNKTASAIKDEQKELRRQSKNQKPEQKRPANAHLAPVFLSDEQRHVLDAVVQLGKSIFFTGSAGTGKSVLMREIIKQLRIKYRREPDRVAVTASTGLAACNIEGVTLHSFAGIGLGKEAVPELVKKVISFSVSFQIA